MQITKEEVVQNLRRQSKGNQQSSSQYRGVTLHQVSLDQLQGNYGAFAQYQLYFHSFLYMHCTEGQVGGANWHPGRPQVQVSHSASCWHQTTSLRIPIDPISNCE